MGEILEACDKLRNANSVSELTAVFSAEISRLGFGRFAYLNVRRLEGQPVHYSTYPIEWIDHYIHQNYHSVDPVISKSASSMIPFAWGEHGEKLRFKGRCRTLFKEAEDWGIKVGLTVPVHSPRGTWAAVTVASGESDPAFLKAITENQPHLQFLANHYHTFIEQLTYADEKSDRVKLSPREVECLKWTAIGKSAWEIGNILNLSATTVTGYLESSKRKLGVFSKSHAIVKAIMEGLIKL